MIALYVLAAVANVAVHKLYAFVITAITKIGKERAEKREEEEDEEKYTGRSGLVAAGVDLERSRRIRRTGPRDMDRMRTTIGKLDLADLLAGKRRRAQCSRQSD